MDSKDEGVLVAMKRREKPNDLPIARRLPSRRHSSPKKVSFKNVRINWMHFRCCFKRVGPQKGPQKWPVSCIEYLEHSSVKY